jgi:endonuclease YncB( thermonuclease family)
MPPAPKRRTVAAAIGAFLLLALPAAAQAPPPRLSTVPALAVDGDTLRVDGQLVRLVGLDAPELHARCAVELELAQAARDRLRELVAGGVNLEYLNARDRYGRLLAIARQPNGYNVADVLIGEGLARRYDGRTARAGWCP